MEWTFRFNFSARFFISPLISWEIYRLWWLIIERGKRVVKERRNNEETAKSHSNTGKGFSLVFIERKMRETIWFSSSNRDDDGAVERSGRAGQLFRLHGPQHGHHLAGPGPATSIKKRCKKDTVNRPRRLFVALKRTKGAMAKNDSGSSKRQPEAGLVCSRLDWIHWSENSTSKRVVNCRLSMTFPNLFNYSDGIFQPLWAMMYAPFSNEINWCNHLQSSLLIRKEEFGTELEEIFVSMCLSHRNSRTGVLLLDLTIINWELLDLHKKMWKWAFSFRKNMAIISTSTRLHR